MPSVPTKKKEHGETSLELVVAVLPIQRHTTQQPPH